MVYPRKLYPVLVDGEVWTFLSNCALEQSVAKVSDGKHVGPVLPFRAAGKIQSTAESWNTVRYCVDWLGRIWYVISSNEQPAGYLDSPCRRACLAALGHHGIDVEMLLKSHGEGEAHVEHLRTYKDDE